MSPSSSIGQLRAMKARRVDFERIAFVCRGRLDTVASIEASAVVAVDDGSQGVAAGVC